MRTVKKTLFHRLSVQAEEAELQGLTKTADALTTQIEKNSSNIRDNSAFYIYSEEDFKKDVEEKIWDIIVRASDFYDLSFDGKEMHKIVEKYANELSNEVRVKIGSDSCVGAYEPTVPGELREKVVIVIDEE